jgi:hypothetical protein
MGGTRVQVNTNVTEAVLSAFRSAKEAGLPTVECYRAGVDAWKRFYPDQAPEYAAKRAVSLILEETTELTIRE